MSNYLDLPYKLLNRETSTFFFFFFNDTATTEIYTLSLHDALPISRTPPGRTRSRSASPSWRAGSRRRCRRSEEHTSELQSRSDLVCRLLLEKKKQRDVTEPPPAQRLRRRQYPQPRACMYLTTADTP